MDFKKFGNVVSILGIVVLLYGGFHWVSNQPNEKLRDHGSWEYMQPKAKQDDAIKILIAGGIVAFLGLGISYSAKKKE